MQPRHGGWVSTLFSSLGDAMTDATPFDLLDLFAGSGALPIEKL